MKVNITVNIDSEDKILLKRNLGSSKVAQRFFTEECAKFMNPYVPFKTGRLKDMNVLVKDDKVIYYAKYAAKQYNSNTGTGIQGTSNGGLRGKLWDKRMIADKGKQLLNEVAEKIGGKAE